jgi:hypothetical protein
MRTDTEAALVQSCRQAATAMGVYTERLNQHRGDKAGSDRGAPDMLVYVGEKVLVCEFKRAKNADGTPAGVLSRDQVVAIERRKAQGVNTYVIDDVRDFAAAVNNARRRR